MIDIGIANLEETFNNTQHNFVVDFQKYLEKIFDSRAEVLYEEYYKDMLELATVEKELALYETSNSVELKKDELTKKESISTHQAGNNDMADLLLTTYKLVYEQKLEWYEEFV